MAVVPSHTNMRVPVPIPFDFFWGGGASGIMKTFSPPTVSPSYLGKLTFTRDVFTAQNDTIPMDGSTSTDPVGEALSTTAPGVSFSADHVPARTGNFPSGELWTTSVDILVDASGDPMDSMSVDIFYKVWKYGNGTIFTRLSPANAPTSDWQLMGSINVFGNTGTLTISVDFVPANLNLKDEVIILEFLATTSLVQLGFGSSITLTIRHSLPSLTTWLQTGHFAQHYYLKQA